MKIGRITAALVLFTLTVNYLAADSRFVVQTGHSGEVRSIERQKSSGLIVSTGSDGTLRVWRRGDLLFSRQVSHLPLTSLAVHPDEPIAAFVATDNINTYRLIVFNWAEARELYSLRIDELPLDIGYSPLGSYLFYSRAEINSLSILDSESGAPLDIAARAFGIVSAAFISNSESTLVSYLPSGSIVYWDMETDQRKADPIPTSSNLEFVNFNSTGRFGIGYRGTDLHLFDLVSGRTLDTLSVPGVIDIAVHPVESSLALILNTGRQRELKIIDFSNRRFRETSRLPLPGSRPTAVAYGADGAVLGLEDGTVAGVSADGTRLAGWVETRLRTISDIDIWNGSLTLSSPGLLTLFDSASLRGDDPRSPRTMTRTTTELPFADTAGFLPLDHSSGVIWNTDSPDSVYRFSVSSASFTPLFELEAAGQEIYTDNDRLLSLDRNGSIVLYSLAESEQLYEYAFTGIRDVAFIDHETILIGRSPSGRFPSPLMRINLRTGETVPLEADELLVFSLQYDPLTRSLYTLGLEERRSGIMTVLQQLRGTNFERSQPLLTFPGEDHSAAFVVNDLRVYTSLGHSGVQVSGWEGFSNLDVVDHIPRKISVDGGLLASLNSDSTVSLWNRTSGDWLGDLYMFEDGEWLLLRGDETLLASAGGEVHVRRYNDAARNW